MAIFGKFYTIWYNKKTVTRSFVHSSIHNFFWKNLDVEEMILLPLLKDGRKTKKMEIFKQLVSPMQKNEFWKQLRMPIANKLIILGYCR